MMTCLNKWGRTLLYELLHHLNTLYSYNTKLQIFGFKRNRHLHISYKQNRDIPIPDGVDNKTKRRRNIFEIHTLNIYFFSDCSHCYLYIILYWKSPLFYSLFIKLNIIRILRVSFYQKFTIPPSPWSYGIDYMWFLWLLSHHSPFLRLMMMLQHVVCWKRWGLSSF